MAMNISDFQRKIGGNWVDLEENPYFNADENIYWDQTDNPNKLQLVVQKNWCRDLPKINSSLGWC